MIKVALLGAWHVHADDYARQLAGSEFAEFAAVWDSDFEAARVFGEAWGVPAVADLQQLLRGAGIDAVIVADAPARKEGLIRSALGAHLHVLTEKLLAYSVMRAQELAELAAGSDLVLDVAMPILTDPVVRVARDLITSGELGAVTTIRIRHSIDGLTAGWLPPRFMEHELALVGCLGDLGCHAFYICDELLDGERPDQVAATVLIDDEANLDVASAVVMRFPRSKTLAILEASEIGPVGIQSFELEVFGKRGLLVYGPDNDQKVRIHRDWGIEEVAIERGTWGSVGLWLESIRGLRPRPDLGPAIRLTETVTRAYEAAAERIAEPSALGATQN